MLVPSLRVISYTSWVSGSGPCWFHKVCGQPIQVVWVVCLALADDEQTQAENDPRASGPHQALIRIKGEVVRLCIFYEGEGNGAGTERDVPLLWAAMLELPYL